MGEGLHSRFENMANDYGLRFMQHLLTGSNTDIRMGIGEIPYGLFGQCLVTLIQ
jgi:hypothetical protein